MKLNKYNSSHTLIYISILSGPPGSPSAPEPLEVSKKSVELTWKAPEEEDGDLPLIGYFIERSQAQNYRWIRMNRDPEADMHYIVKDLMEGTDYVFRIIAVNKVGEGPPGPKSGNITAKNPWGTYYDPS